MTASLSPGRAVLARSTATAAPPGPLFSAGAPMAQRLDELEIYLAPLEAQLRDVYARGDLADMATVRGIAAKAQAQLDAECGPLPVEVRIRLERFIAVARGRESEWLDEQWAAICAAGPATRARVTAGLRQAALVCDLVPDEVRRAMPKRGLVSVP